MPFEMMALLLGGGLLAAFSLFNSGDDQPDPEVKEVELGDSGPAAQADPVADAKGVEPDGTLIYRMGDEGSTLDLGAPYTFPVPPVARIEVYGEGHDDNINIHVEGTDVLADGGAGDDMIRSDLAGSDDTLLGGAGNDRLFGSSDSLDGGAGDDDLIAAPGWRLEDGAALSDTTLTGGAGRDAFVIDADNDWRAADGTLLMPDVQITDFEAGEKLYLPPVLSHHDADGSHKPHEPQYVLGRYDLAEVDGSTVITLTYDPAAEGAEPLTRSVTLTGVIGLSGDAIEIGYRSLDSGEIETMDQAQDQTSLAAGGAAVHLWADDDPVRLDISEAERVTASLGAGNDVLGAVRADPPDRPYPRPSVILAGAGDDSVSVDEGDWAFGQEGNDTLAGDTARLDGGSGDDVISLAQTPALAYDSATATGIANAGTGADRVVLRGTGVAVDLGADRDADVIEMDPVSPVYGDPVPTTVSQFGAEDHLILEVDAGAVVTSQREGDQITLMVDGHPVIRIDWTGDEAPVLDPGQPGSIYSLRAAPAAQA